VDAVSAAPAGQAAARAAVLAGATAAPSRVAAIRPIPAIRIDPA
jgi:hypothetical protein